MTNKQRDTYLRRKYGISLSSYNYRLKEQKGGCAICGRKPKIGGRRLHVDHDHHTKVVRGLLCWKCNRGLQYFRDKPELFYKAAKYLERSKL